MIQNLIFGILFLKILFWAYNLFIFVRTFQWTSSEFFLNFIFSTRKSQNRQKLAKRITHFTIQICSKNLTHLRTSTHLTLKIMCSRNTTNNLSDFTNFPAKMFLYGVRFALHHFLTPKNCILFLKDFESKCLCISLYLRKKAFVSKT